MRILIIAILGLVLTSFAIPPIVKVTVVDNLGNHVEGAEVVLYDTKEDYEKEVNPVAKETTDSKGRVTFKKLEPKSYFIHVFKGDMNNNWSGVQTDNLLPNKINKMIVVIE